MSIGYPSKTSPMISNRSQQIHCQFLTALAASIAAAWLWDHWITFEAFYLGQGSFASEGGGSRYLAVCFTTSSQNSKAPFGIFFTQIYQNYIPVDYNDSCCLFQNFVSKKIEGISRNLKNYTPKKKEKNDQKRRLAGWKRSPPLDFK